MIILSQWLYSWNRSNTGKSVFCTRSEKHTSVWNSKGWIKLGQHSDIIINMWVLLQGCCVLMMNIWIMYTKGLCVNPYPWLISWLILNQHAMDISVYSQSMADCPSTGCQLSVDWHVGLELTEYWLRCWSRVSLACKQAPGYWKSTTNLAQSADDEAWSCFVPRCWLFVPNLLCSCPAVCWQARISINTCLQMPLVHTILILWLFPLVLPWQRHICYLNHEHQKSVLLNCMQPFNIKETTES